MKLIPGKNDLATKFPEIADEADGWEPSTVTAGSGKKLPWKCSKGHRWSATVGNRTYHSRGCPVCAGQQVLAGYNDLATTHPEIANEADGWKPSTVTAGCNKKLPWKCSKFGHRWSAQVSSRTFQSTGCPVCSGNQLLAGYNDLATTHPELANEAVDYELTKTVPAGSRKKLKWQCSKGHRWSATVNSRTGQQSGCPVCADYGFSPAKPAYLYLMKRRKKRRGEYQIGITNDPSTRIRTHKREGWKLLDLYGPALGTIVYQQEHQLKQWLKKTHGTITGTTENWYAKLYSLKTLHEIFRDANVNLLMKPNSMRRKFK